MLLIDHAERVAEKIRISGGGRCNFTNLHTGPANFFSKNPDYCRSALARHTPRDVIALLERHRVGWHEKHLGQLFCDGSSQQVIDVLLAECDAGGVTRWQPCPVTEVAQRDGRFHLATGRGAAEATHLVVATGGLSIPKIGASDFGHRLARQFGHRIVEPRPALVPFELAEPERTRAAELAGVSLPATLATGMTGGKRQRVAFTEDLLFTHRGLSGPAALQISTPWQPGQPLAIDLVPGTDLAAALLDAKRQGAQRPAAALAPWLPRRVAEAWLCGHPQADRPLADWRDRDLAALAASLEAWTVTPSGTEGYRKAEVTAGGVDTRELDSKGGESRRVAGLYFIGEVVDVTGWLGGYNFQWAWASAAACAEALAAAAGARGHPPF